MSTSHSARPHNHLLAALPPAVADTLGLRLEAVDLATDAMLYEAGNVLRHVHFPVTAIVSLVSPLQDGGAAEVAVVGAEGVVGVCAFMGGGRALSSATVQRPGLAWRMSARDIADLACTCEPVREQLLRYTQALFSHMAQGAACYRHHTLGQQVCRWLLQQLDRQAGDELHVTQERIAGLLGVRREGVTGAALKLQSAGIIRYRRGCIRVLDRAALEAASCECYGVVRQAYERLRSGSAQWPQPPGAAARAACTPPRLACA